MVKIFIGNLSQDTTVEELRALFSQYGKIAECDIVKNYGFVHMDDRAEADEAIRALHHYMLNGQPMNVERSHGKARGSAKLHVGNLACSNQELRARFEEFGGVLECDIVKDYAFVHMERMEDAMEAIAKLDNSPFKGKLMSVKLSTSRLRTAPGMGERSGCYRCGQDGHWSKECPLDQSSWRGGGGGGANGAEPRSNGYGAPSRFGGRGGGGRNRDYHPGYGGGDPDFGDGYAPVHGFPRGSAAGYGRGAGYESSMGYGVAAEHNMAQMYGGSSSAYGNGGGSLYGAPPYPPAGRRPSGDDRDPYGVVDFYEKYRAQPPPYGAGGYFEERHSVPLPPPPSSHSSAAAAMMREHHLPPSGLDPYERHAHPPPPPPPAAGGLPSYYAMRDRSPIRRVPAEAPPDGYAFENSRLSSMPPASSAPRGSAYDLGPRSAYAERPRYAY